MLAGGYSDMKEKRPAIGTPGSSSLMVIFAVLCIAIFAVLSLSTSLAGKRLAESSAESVYDFYRADCEAEKTLTLLRNGVLPEDVEKNGDVYTYFVPVSDSRAIQVEVSVSGEEYEIRSWNTVYMADWAADEKIDVWAGEEIG